MQPNFYELLKFNEKFKLLAHSLKDISYDKDMFILMEKIIILCLKKTHLFSTFIIIKLIRNNFFIHSLAICS